MSDITHYAVVVGSPTVVSLSDVNESFVLFIGDQAGGPHEVDPLNGVTKDYDDAPFDLVDQITSYVEQSIIPQGSSIESMSRTYAITEQLPSPEHAVNSRIFSNYGIGFFANRSATANPETVTFNFSYITTNGNFNVWVLALIDNTVEVLLQSELQGPFSVYSNGEIYTVGFQLAYPSEPEPEQPAVRRSRWGNRTLTFELCRPRPGPPFVLGEVEIDSLFRPMSPMGTNTELEFTLADNSVVAFTGANAIDSSSPYFNHPYNIESAISGGRNDWGEVNAGNVQDFRHLVQGIYANTSLGEPIITTPEMSFTGATVVGVDMQNNPSSSASAPVDRVLLLRTPGATNPSLDITWTPTVTFSGRIPDNSDGTYRATAAQMNAASVVQVVPLLDAAGAIVPGYVVVYFWYNTWYLRHFTFNDNGSGREVTLSLDINMAYNGESRTINYTTTTQFMEF